MRRNAQHSALSCRHICSPSGYGDEMASYLDVDSNRRATDDTFNPATIDDQPIVLIPVSQLIIGGSPRLSGINFEHVKSLVELDGEFPPITVHRHTMQVIDGAHRLQAAILCGKDRIAARFFSGEQKDAFVLAVSANSRHGLPLSLDDRMAAAIRILRSHPQWSDRAIAGVTQLAHQTVGELRRRATGDADQLHRRIGRDGRARPLNSAGARRQAAELMSGSPDMSLRQIAKAVGLSPGTVRDVRARLHRNENPVPPQQQIDEQPAHSAVAAAAATIPARCTTETVTAIRGSDAAEQAADALQILRTLQKDPSLRFTEVGRVLLRLLGSYAILTDQADSLAKSVPAHCADSVRDAARACATAWLQLAEEIGDPIDESAA